MKRILPLLLLVCILFSGCSPWSSTYVQVTPSKGRTAGFPQGTVPVKDYNELLNAMLVLVFSGAETGVIATADMGPELLSENAQAAARHIQMENPLGAYAVEKIDWEIRTGAENPSVAVSVQYRRSTVEARKILQVRNMAEVETVIHEALEDVISRVVMQVEAYEEIDLACVVEKFSERNPQSVMETPEIVEAVYGSGESRVLELFFVYQNSRDALRQMQQQVRPVFDSAELYVSTEASDFQKYSQLYAFLMERFDYRIETSITPAYSLLHHGVGDCRAFAMVYAAMCRGAGLNCEIITGTRFGIPWCWNILLDENRYYHVDLLEDPGRAGLRERLDSDMEGYLWDQTAYPACDGIEIPQSAETDVSTQEKREEETESALWAEPDFAVLWDELFYS